MQRGHGGRRGLGVGQPKLAGVQRRHLGVCRPDGRVVAAERRAPATRGGRHEPVMALSVSGARAPVSAVAGRTVVVRGGRDHRGPRAGRQRAVPSHRDAAVFGRRRRRESGRLRPALARRHVHHAGQLFTRRRPDVRFVRTGPPVVPAQHSSPAPPRVTCQNVNTTYQRQSSVQMAIL